jgi:hypothetical protein
VFEILRHKFTHSLFPNNNPGRIQIHLASSSNLGVGGWGFRRGHKAARSKGPERTLCLPLFQQDKSK